MQPPVPVDKWPKNISALTVPNPCPQLIHGSSKSHQGTEDCLYLNIYTPATNGTSALPVMFWLHGGGFNFGTSGYFGARYVMDRDFILVTVNYRIGVFGFLSTGDEVVPGNMGLKDQSLALRWVSKNIRHFGGDPQRITLAGLSAGAASVHYHYLSPMSKRLFRNGISFSGTSLAPWAYSPNSTEKTNKFACTLNCTTDSTVEMIRCLKSLSTKTIMEAVYMLTVQF